MHLVVTWPTNLIFFFFFKKFSGYGAKSTKMHVPAKKLYFVTECKRKSTTIGIVNKKEDWGCSN